MIIVAGHVCLDIIPNFLGPTPLDPGTLVRVGAATLSTGGVSNVGMAIHRLGAPVKLIHRIGDDLFGNTLKSLFGPDLSSGIRTLAGETTSYSVVVAPPGVDRMFIHCPGSNGSFGADDVPADSLRGASHLHLGYPPTMHRLLDRDGAECATIFKRARAAGLTTSLDLCSIDPNSEAGQTDWLAWLRNVLPHVDVFTPSYDELAVALGEPIITSAGGAERLSSRCLELGARAVLLKMGSSGLYYATATHRLHQPCFSVDVVTATGAGDCTIAGFLVAGVIERRPIEEQLRFACAVGGCCCEAVDATSGVRTIAATDARVSAGWQSMAASSFMTEAR